MIKNIIFDFGGVLVDWNPRYFYRSVFTDEKEMEYFLTNICTERWDAEHDRGVPFEDNIHRLQALHPEYRKEIGLFREGWSSMLKSDKPDTVAVLRKLADKDYNIYGLTNWSAETIDYLFGRFPFFSVMKGVVVSGQEKVIKPDARIYNILLHRYDLKADECLFIDDNADNVAAAKRLGIHGIRFLNAEILHQELSDLLPDFY